MTVNEFDLVLIAVINVICIIRWNPLIKHTLELQKRDL